MCEHALKRLSDRASESGSGWVEKEKRGNH